ncbi:MAG: transcription termination factor NusA [Caldisericaceae bacterium]
MIDIETLRNIEKEEGIPKEKIIEIIINSMKEAYKKQFGEENAVVKINLAKGEIKLYAEKIVVERVINPVLEISLKEASKFETEAKLGDKILIEIPLKSLNSSAIMAARQVFMQGVAEKRKEHLAAIFSEKLGQIVKGRVARFKGKGSIGISLDVGTQTIEGTLPFEEQIPNERLLKGKEYEFYVKEVKLGERNPVIILSRTDPNFLGKLFEREIPEIAQKIIEIKGIVRSPGERAKVIVLSKDLHVDPVGACIGPKGVRINSISKVVNYEKIDIIRYNPNAEILIANALSPAEVKKVEIIPNTKEANVYVDKKEAPVAMGKEGINVSLASSLTGYNIHLIEVEEGENNEERK